MIKKSQNQVELCRAGTEKQDTKGIVSATDYFQYQAVSSWKNEEETQTSGKHWTINSIQIGSGMGKINVGFPHLLWTCVYTIVTEYDSFWASLGMCG